MFLQTLQRVLYTNRWFYLPYLLLLVPALVLQFTVHQFNISLWVNRLHNPTLDFAFNYLTDLGDGLFAAAIAVMLLLYCRKFFWPAVLSFYVPAIITQVLKRLVFADHLRPGLRMKHLPDLHFVPGVTIHEYNSFPSGHSTSAFAVFLFLALISSRKPFGLLFLVVAILVGLSRIYLLQHFFEDVLTGSLIGVTCTTLIYTLFEQKRATQQQPH